jgi:uncharacterized protein (DUF983 family)
MSIIVENAAGPVSSEEAPRDVWQAIRRGMALRCPACGQGRMYGKYLKVEHACSACHCELHHQRADDAPPYFTMFVVGHIVIAGVLAVEKKFAPSLLVHVSLWFPLTIGLSLWLLPKIKGGLIALQWALRMHGFGNGPDPGEPDPVPLPSHSEGRR